MHPGRLLTLFVSASLVAAALAGGAGASTNVSTPPASVVTVRTHVITTTRGPVEYRAFGTGPNLVLIMGYAGSLQTWDPHFLDMLALHFHVITFDNAGIAKTATLSSPLSIDAMADQTSALISALHLGDPNVLGWSMGSMIAQALAIRHPHQVRRLVLCATYPGGGDAVAPSQKDVAALTGSNAAAAEADLFPADQAMAADAFNGSLAAYSSAPTVAASVIAAQKVAVLAWFGGHDRAGRAAKTIVAPTLVADGAEDRLDVTANDRAVASDVPGARLTLYAHAGHAFLFQEGASFTFLVDTFLTAAPPSLTAAQLRPRYLADFKAAIAVGRRWVTGLQALGSKASAHEVARLDLAQADAAGTLDDQLLGFEATGALGTSIRALVAASELTVRDELALGALSGRPATTWGAVIKADAAVVLRDENALRHRLRLAPIVAPTTTTTTTTTTTRTTTTFSY